MTWGAHWGLPVPQAHLDPLTVLIPWAFSVSQVQVPAGEGSVLPRVPPAALPRALRLEGGVPRVLLPVPGESPPGVPSVAGGQELWGGTVQWGGTALALSIFPAMERDLQGRGCWVWPGPGAALRELMEPWIAGPLRAPGLSAHGAPGVQGGAAQVPRAEPTRPAGARHLRAGPVSAHRRSAGDCRLGSLGRG